MIKCRYRTGLNWGNNNYVNDNEGWFPSKNIVVQGNNISYTGGDAVVLIATKNSFIDHNTVFHANYLGRTGYANAGIWPHSSIDFTMQYNEVAYTHLEHGVVDGEGIDVDIACVNTLVQFNYVHHNDGGGILLCNYKSDGEIGNHRGTIIRNNVFYDNGKDFDKGAFLTTSSAVKDVSVYNNLVVATNRLSSLTFVLSADWAKIGKNENFTFKNNIFVGTGSVNGRFNISEISYCKFQNNLFYQVGSKSIINDSQEQFYYNPELNIPDNYDGYDKALMFRPQNPKVFIDGLVFSGMLDKDMEGNDVEGVNYLGAFSK